MIKGIIFDLDGVIVSTDKYHYQAWKALSERENIVFDEVINNKLRGVSRLESLEIILSSSSKTYSNLEKEEMCTYKNNIYIKLLEQLNKNDILDGVIDLLAYLKLHNIKTAIGSSSKNAKTILTKIGLINNFDYICDGSMISKSKPDPEVFLKARDGLNLKSEECIVVEDAFSGIEAASKANIKSFGVGDAVNCNLSTYKSLKLIDIINYLY